MNPALVLIKGSIINKKGNEKIYLPAKAITTARITDKMIVKVLILFEILALDAFTNQFKIK